mmetsp:Transcript_16819/g.50300  ORF Transcript_16819/g.50300 Transcript_16819/m.50300 type:complete len:202 (+) Transcript_16819:478-1083(+)
MRPARRRSASDGWTALCTLVMPPRFCAASRHAETARTGARPTAGDWPRCRRRDSCMRAASSDTRPRSRTGAGSAVFGSRSSSARCPPSWRVLCSPIRRRIVSFTRCLPRTGEATSTGSTAPRGRKHAASVSTKPCSVRSGVRPLELLAEIGERHPSKDARFTAQSSRSFSSQPAALLCSLQGTSLLVQCRPIHARSVHALP